jgi:hypothetical protein
VRGERKRGITVDKLKALRKLAFVTFAALAIALTAHAPSQARGMEGHGFGGHPGAQHHFEGHHDFDRRFHHGFLFDPAFPYYGYYPPAPAYWYYCPSYGAYYPNVSSCPEAWVPVPAS